jgi:hypothetical protein
METGNWKSEYELRQFIDAAVRTPINAIYKSKTENNPFPIFNYYLTTARENYDLFCNQLNEKLTAVQNWKAIEIDLKYRFLGMINHYIKWYEINKNETDKFEPYNPYSLMLNIIESTKSEILKYFPNIEDEIKTIGNPNKTTYVWQSNPDKELPKLYNLMKNKYKLIAEETTYEQFNAVFTGQPTENIKPIKWLVAKNLNAYFIEQLVIEKKLSKAANKDVWDIAKKCFTNGKHFSQLVDLYNNNKSGKPKNHNLIDELINTL